jgi:hypothetical protein
MVSKEGVAALGCRVAGGHSDPYLAGPAKAEKILEEVDERGLLVEEAEKRAVP